MIDKELIKNKINFIQKELDRLGGFKDLSFEEIISDYFKHTVVERILERIINDAIDINQHIIAELKESGVPNDYKETFEELVNLKVFDKDFAMDVSQSVGLRNILVHNYRKLDEKLFYKSIKSCLSDYTKYCDYILKFIKKNGN